MAAASQSLLVKNVYDENFDDFFEVTVLYPQIVNLKMKFKFNLLLHKI